MFPSSLRGCYVALTVGGTVPGCVCDMVRHKVNEISITLPVIIRAVVSSLESRLSQEYLLLLSFLLLRSYSTTSVSKRSGIPAIVVLRCFALLV
jgi:hypothetical protein